MVSMTHISGGRDSYVSFFMSLFLLLRARMRNCSPVGIEISNDERIHYSDSRQLASLPTGLFPRVGDLPTVPALVFSIL